MNLLDGTIRDQVEARVREQVAAGALGPATDAVESLAAGAGDEPLARAARASAEDAAIDWVEVSAEAIEADVRLQGLEQVGCRQVVLELGNLPETRLDVMRRYFGASSGPEGRTGHPSGRLGAAYGHGRDVMRVTGVEPLAELQLARYPLAAPPEAQQAHARRVLLAGLLLVLRFFGVVARCAETRGLPFPVRLDVTVESIGGEDAIRQLGPRLATRMPCAVRPLSDDVARRLEARHAARVARWHEDTDTLLRNLRAKFDAHGYAPSFMLPDALGETKQRLARLERSLLHLDPLHRLTRRSFEELLVRVREARERTVPDRIDAGRYR